MSIVRASDDPRVWTGEYRQLTKHRKRCRGCHRLIADGERFASYTKEREGESELYGVFTKIKRFWYHETCFDRRAREVGPVFNDQPRAATTARAK